MVFLQLRPQHHSAMAVIQAAFAILLACDNIWQTLWKVDSSMNSLRLLSALNRIVISILVQLIWLVFAGRLLMKDLMCRAVPAETDSTWNASVFAAFPVSAFGIAAGV